MGNVWSETSASPASQPAEINESSQSQELGESSEATEIAREDDETDHDLAEFRSELSSQRQVRQLALAALGENIRRLKEELAQERTARLQAEDALFKAGLANATSDATDDTPNPLIARAEKLENQVRALKDVANIGKQMLSIREAQVVELHKKLRLLEETGVQYEREVANMRQLRLLYEERATAREAESRLAVERERARLSVATTRLRLAQTAQQDAEERATAAEERVSKLDAERDTLNEQVSELRVELASTKESLGRCRADLRALQRLLGPGLDVERLTRQLQHHQQLVTQLTQAGQLDEVVSVLLDIADRADPAPEEETQEDPDLAQKLAKIWSLLFQLLGHPPPEPPSPLVANCFKTVASESGPPRIAISVSGTFLTLKDLILAKNSLVQEVSRLKTLNSHLESRLEEQQTRLGQVTCQLNQTWEVVGKLRAQHQHLHGFEKILRYELAMKRKLLNELKVELQLCRDQAALAREKNSQTEKDWLELRREFASRKAPSEAESGYGDDPDTPSSPSSPEDPLTPISSATSSPSPSPLQFEEPDPTPQPGPSTLPTIPEEPPQDESPSTPLTLEQRLAAREERFRRMEQETAVLFQRMDQTSRRSDLIASKLDQIHQQYGPGQDPPP